MFRLTFQYQPEYENDTIQVAYSIPYTYNQLQQFLQRLIQGESNCRFYARKTLFKN